MTVPYPGISELLRELQHKGIALAVASNKYQEGTEKLVHYYFKDIVFSTILGQREGIPVKPDPVIVKEILRVNGVSANETLYVGDSGVDMQTAAAATVTSVGVTWGFRTCEELVENGACYIVDSPAEILRTVRSSLIFYWCEVVESEYKNNDSLSSRNGCRVTKIYRIV